MQFNSLQLGPLWPTADEVETSRGVLIGTAQASVSARAAMSVFKRYYPGHSEDIDKILAIDWARDPWAMCCEARDYKPGDLHKFWPVVIQPVGRVHFAGAYCDNQSWGMEAATRSRVRVAHIIHDEVSA
jgi:monoamine oxidase